MLPSIPIVRAQENTWTSLAPMPTARNSLGVAAVNGKIYAIGGLATYINGRWETNVNEEFDPTTNKWTPKNPMPTARSGFGIAVYQNKIYCIGGGIDSVYNTGVNEVYDPATDTWETKTSMPTPRICAVTNIVQGRIYIIGGIQDRTTGKSSTLNEMYDPATDTWIIKTPIPAGVHNAASAVVDNKIYVIGDGNSNQIYDPETDKWTLGMPNPVSITATAAGATTGLWAPKRIYVIGGRVDYGMGGSNINQVYNPDDDSWTVGSSMLTARYALAIGVVNDKLYVIGGTPMFSLPADQLSVNEQYTPFGYIGPSLTPTPTLTPLPTSSPTLTVSPTPTPSPSPSPDPSPSPSPESESDFPTIQLLTLALTVIIGLGILAYSMKKRRS